MNKILSAIVLSGIVGTAHAQTIVIGSPEIDDTIESLPGASESIRTSLSNLQDSINESVPALNMKEMANSTTLAGSGVDADYSDTFSWALLGVNAGVGAGSNIFSVLKSDLRAEDFPTASAQFGVLLGFNLGKVVKTKLGPIDMERMKIFVSFFTFNYNLPSDSFAATFDTTHWSLKAQYKLFTGKGPGAARWTGVDVTSGLSQSKVGLAVTTDVNQSVAVSDVPGLTEMSFSGSPTITVSSSTFTIPVDISTGVQLGYFLNLYGGLGLDFSFGSASIPGTELGNIQSTSDLVTAPVTLNDNSEGPTVMNLRYFAGLGLDGQVIGAYAQFNGNVTGQLGVTAGARLYW